MSLPFRLTGRWQAGGRQQAAGSRQQAAGSRHQTDWQAERFSKADRLNNRRADGEMDRHKKDKLMDIQTNIQANRKPYKQTNLQMDRHKSGCIDEHTYKHAS